MLTSFVDFLNSLGFDTWSSFVNSPLVNVFLYIYELCFTSFEYIFNFLFSWLNLPDFPDELKVNIYNFTDLIFDNLDLLGFFVRLKTLSILLPLFLVVFNLRILFKIFMWFYNKALAGLHILGILKF